MRRRTLIIAALALTATGVFAAPALGCSCAPHDDLEQSVRQSKGAVVAKLLEVIDRGGLRSDYRYRVKVVVKGKRRLDAGQILVVASAQDSATCGLPRQEGSRYGLLLGRAEGRWTSNLCQVVDPKDLREAGAGRAGRDPSAGCAN